jgi:hypothetical protein
VKKKIGRFIFDLVVKYINYLDDDNFDRLSERVYRPEFTRRRPLPVANGMPFRMFEYKPLGSVRKTE